MADDAAAATPKPAARQFGGGGGVGVRRTTAVGSDPLAAAGDTSVAGSVIIPQYTSANLPAAASSPSLTTAASSPTRPRTQQERQVRAVWREKLAAYFSIRAPKKTERDVDLALDHFEPPKGAGFDKMWDEAVARFGSEPPAEQMDAARLRIRWYAKLSSYYALLDSSKTHSDIIALMDKFVMEGRSYEELWDRVQEKYGVYIDKPASTKGALAASTTSSAAVTGAAPRPGTMAAQIAAEVDRLDYVQRHHEPRSTAGRTHSPLARRPNTDEWNVSGAYDDYGPDARSAAAPRSTAQAKNLPLRPSNLIQKSLFAILVAGVWMKLYRAASPAAQSRFHRAVAAEIGDLTNLTSDLAVTKVSDHVDGVVVEIDFEVPAGWSAEGIGTELVRKVTNGECTVAAIRQAYLDHLGGNAQRVYIADAAVVTYFTSPGMRYNVALTGRATGGYATNVGVVRDDFQRPDSAAANAFAAAGASARDHVVYPRGGDEARTPPARQTHFGGAHSPRQIVEPTVSSAASPGMVGPPPRDRSPPLMYDSAGRRIPEHELIPRQAVPKVLAEPDRWSGVPPRRGAGAGGSGTFHQQPVPSLPSHQLQSTPAAGPAGSSFGTVLPEGARPAQPASFMQLYQMGDWHTPGLPARGNLGDPSFAGGYADPLSGATPTSRAREAHVRRGGVPVH
jgi:hypothetical protein